MVNWISARFICACSDHLVVAVWSAKEAECAWHANDPAAIKTSDKSVAAVANYSVILTAVILLPSARAGGRIGSVNKS
jgi:hypothetical protein